MNYLTESTFDFLYFSDILLKTIASCLPGQIIIFLSVFQLVVLVEGHHAGVCVCVYIMLYVINTL